VKQNPPAPDRPRFEKWVHEALTHLYDTPYLQTHALADCLPRGEPEPHLPRSQLLRKALLEAIESMRPPSGTPAQSPDWRGYRILELRYIEGLSPGEVMKRMGLARSQYFHEQARVIESLTSSLWDQQLTRGLAEPAPFSEAREALARTEADRLSARATWEPVDLISLLDDLKAVVQPLAASRGAEARLEPLEHLTVLYADRIMVRQALLALITAAIEARPSGRIALGDFASGDEIGLRVQALPGEAPHEAPRDREGPSPSLEICEQLMRTMGGRVGLAVEEEGPWEGRLIWRAQVPCALIVVDDNEGLIDLFRRYLVGYPWQVLGAASAAEARQLLSEVIPAAIVLDVMMPGEDGWETLLSLKAAEATRSIPVIICSVLREPALALSLGANAYLPKPVTQQALLQALAPWLQPPRPLAPEH
jgi:CheY-like chemotaxis protein